MKDSEKTVVRLVQEAADKPLIRIKAGQLPEIATTAEAAIVEAGHAIAINPNDPIGYEAMTAALIYAGRPAEAAIHIKQAMRLDPWFPQEYFYWLGLAEFGMERFESAVVTLTNATGSNPDDDRSLLILAAAYGHLE